MVATPSASDTSSANEHITVFVTTLVGKQSQLRLPITTTVQDFFNAVCAKEEFDPATVRLAFCGKTLERTDDKTTLRDINLQNHSTVQCLFRMRGGGQVDVDVLFNVLGVEVEDAIKRAPHIVGDCHICGDENKLVVQLCCLRMCNECVLSQLKSCNFTFRCTACHESPTIGSLLRSETIEVVANQYRATVENLKFVNVQICTCGSMNVNDNMLSDVTCSVCRRRFCFFCNKKWDASRMRGQKFKCADDCYYAAMLEFETTPFAYGSGDIPLRRMCPSCHVFGAYDGKCKFHTCSDCGHDFCFVCLKGKKECGKSYSNVFCGPSATPEKQTFAEQTLDDLPRLA